MKTLRVVFAVLLLLAGLEAAAQPLDASAKRFKADVTADGRRAVSGFASIIGKQTDDKAFAGAMLWVVANVCQSGLEGIKTVDYERRAFDFDFAFASLPASGNKNVYHCDATVRVSDGRLVFSVTDIMVEQEVVVMKKLTAMDKLQPEKKRAHAEIIDDFERAVSVHLNALTAFAVEHPKQPVTHAEEVRAHKVVKGMTAEEVLLSVGKPLMVSGSGEVQWKYSDSFYVFLKNNVVDSVLK